MYSQARLQKQSSCLFLEVVVQVGTPLFLSFFFVSMTVHAVGYWLHAGGMPVKMILGEVGGFGHVIFGEMPIEDEYAHGHFHFLPLLNGKCKLILSFHHSNRNVDNIGVLCLEQLAGNLFYEIYEKQAMLYLHHVSSALNVYDVIYGCSQLYDTDWFVQNHLGLELSDTVHSVLMWIHPPSTPSYIALHKDGQGIQYRHPFCGWTPSSWAMAVSRQDTFHSFPSTWSA